MQPGSRQGAGGPLPPGVVAFNNMQIMRPGGPPAAPPKSVATVSPRVIAGNQMRPGPTPIPTQVLQSMQGSSQGHLLLKTDGGQYQLLRVGPNSPVLARPPILPAMSGAPSSSQSGMPMMESQGGQVVQQMPQHMQPQAQHMQPQPQHMQQQPQHMQLQMPQHMQPQMPQHMQQQMPQHMQQQMPQMQQIMPQQQMMASGSGIQSPQPGYSQTGHHVVKPPDNSSKKCRNFLANLLDLSSKEPPSVERNVRNLIQELIDGAVEPNEFCDRLERLLNASPQPCLIGFLKKSLPLLRQSLALKELVIEGILPPPPHVAFPAPTPLNAMPLSTASIAQQKPSGIAVLQNIPVAKMTGKVPPKGQRGLPAPSTSTHVLGRSLLKEKERKPVAFGAFDDKMAGDDDINDVAAMGGVNLQEETQRILGNTDLIGSQLRSCNEQVTPSAGMVAHIRAACAERGLSEPAPEVAQILTLALAERMKTLIEQLVVSAMHRQDPDCKMDDRYEVSQDVKGQLKFLEELDRVEKKRREDSERELLLRAAKSRSKTEDPEQAKLKAKAKEMQRAEMEELRQREANLTALQAIGPRKRQRTDAPPEATPPNPHTQPIAGRGAMALRARMKRVALRDILHMMENDRTYARSHILYKAYLRA